MGSTCHHEEILPTNTFTQVFNGPLDDLSTGLYMLYKHLHWNQLAKDNLTYFYLPIFDQNHWHLIRGSLEDKRFVHMSSRNNINSHNTKGMYDTSTFTYQVSSIFSSLNSLLVSSMHRWSTFKDTYLFGFQVTTPRNGLR